MTAHGMNNQAKNNNHTKIQDQLPLFLPDATHGVVRSLDSADIAQTGIQSLMINTFHLRQKPGLTAIKQAGGMKKLMNWEKILSSDSGGFQLFSLINDNPDLGQITDKGVVTYTGPKQQTKLVFTPEKSIRAQFVLGSDIMICLDDFTPPEADINRIKTSVQRTIDWAARSKAEFERQLKEYDFTEQNRPLLVAPIQGHRHWKLRKKCAQELMQIEFDIYGLGGWPFNKNGQFDYEMVERNSQLTPNDHWRFALGIGTPDNIARLYQMGYDLFDCVLPTRDARHQRLYTWSQSPDQIELSSDQSWYDYVYLGRGSAAQNLQPISLYCSCHTCRHYSRAYLHHLFKIKDPTAWRLATIHNLHFYARLMQKLAAEK